MSENPCERLQGILLSKSVMRGSSDLLRERGRASAEAYVPILELREARSRGERVSAFHNNGRLHH
jgi:hypothetical protein